MYQLEQLPLRFARLSDSVVIITRHLFDIPLYAYYVVTIDEFYPSEIEGTLMSPPFEFYGPFDTLAEADIVFKQLSGIVTDVDNPTSVS